VSTFEDWLLRQPFWLLLLAPIAAVALLTVVITVAAIGTPGHPRKWWARANGWEDE
jgi:hypothetical protein